VRCRKGINIAAWQIREVLKMRFVGSAREAFESLDLDRDGKLSKKDLDEGLKKVCAYLV
jgi:Ca2+-binding EF-hand superfamily protein